MMLLLLLAMVMRRWLPSHLMAQVPVVTVPTDCLTMVVVVTMVAVAVVVMLAAMMESRFKMVV